MVGTQRSAQVFFFAEGVLKGLLGGRGGWAGLGRGLGPHVIKVYLTVDLCARPFMQAYGGLRSRNNAGLSSKLESQQSRVAA